MRKNTNVTSYEKRLIHITAWNLMGDRGEAHLPVKAVRKLVGAMGRLPVPMDGISNGDLVNLMSALTDCFDQEMTGDIIGLTTAEGMNIRIYID